MCRNLRLEGEVGELETKQRECDARRRRVEARLVAVTSRLANQSSSSHQLSQSLHSSFYEHASQQVSNKLRQMRHAIGIKNVCFGSHFKTGAVLSRNSPTRKILWILN